MPPSDFLTRQQIADLYPIPISTLKKLGMRGRIDGPPVIRLGGRVYYHLPTFEKWLLSYQGIAHKSVAGSSTRVRRRGRPTKAEVVDRRRAGDLDVAIAEVVRPSRPKAGLRP